MKQVATALGHIHKQKIVHGNIKPSNIIFATSRDLYSLKVIGFDNASLFEQSRQIDDRFDEMVDWDDLCTKMSIRKKVIVYQTMSK